MTLSHGLIGLWNGAIVDIPDGFALCDGTQGTPDLRDRFVVGAGDTYSVNDTGGTNSHTHDFDSDGHFHTLDSVLSANGGFGNSRITSTEILSGVTDPPSNMIPFYALAYIMHTS